MVYWYWTAEKVMWLLGLERVGCSSEHNHLLHDLVLFASYAWCGASTPLSTVMIQSMAVLRTVKVTGVSDTISNRSMVFDSNFESGEFGRPVDRSFALEVNQRMKTVHSRTTRRVEQFFHSSAFTRPEQWRVWGLFAGEEYSIDREAECRKKFVGEGPSCHTELWWLD